MQQRLAGTRRRQKGKKSAPQDAPLAGRLFDEAGAPMTPTYSVKTGRRRYRYYASPSTFRGERPTVSIARVPAVPLETLLGEALQRLALPASANTNAILQRVDIRTNSIALQLDRDAVLDAWRATGHGLNDRDLIAHHRGTLAAGEVLSDEKKYLLLTLPVRARFRGGRSGLLAAPGSALKPAGPDASLIKAVARAHGWKAMLLSGEVPSIDALAVRLGQERRHVGRTLALAFLSPAITRAILAGEQPAGLRLSHLLDADIPLSWTEQKAMIERLAAAQTLP